MDDHPYLIRTYGQRIWTSNVNGKLALNSQNYHLWTPRRPMDDHPYTLETNGSVWIRKDS